MANLLLTEEERMLQNTVRDFAERELMPRSKEIDEKEEFSWENWKGMASLGLTGMGIDPKYGGLRGRLPPDGNCGRRNSARRRVSQRMSRGPHLPGRDDPV